MRETAFNEAPTAIRWLTITPDFIISTVCDFYKIKKESIFIKSRKGHIVKARQITCFLLKIKAGLSLKAIAKMFSYCKSAHGVDHTTVMRAVNKVKNLASTDDAYHAELMEISSMIGGNEIKITPVQSKYIAKVKSIEVPKPEAVYSNSSPFKIAK